MADTGFRQNNMVDGYSFYTEKDAALAMQEQKKIEYIEARMNYHNPSSILNIYKKAIRERIFRTPVGIAYLKQLQAYLQERPELAGEEIPPIPLYQSYESEIREQASPARKRVQPPKKKKSAALPLSIILNITLVLAVIAMFAITLNSEHPNVLNYEKALTNQYATWEQELTEREQVIREKERELKLDTQ